jgi:hypothetical protein
MVGLRLLAVARLATVFLPAVAFAEEGFTGVVLRAGAAAPPPGRAAFFAALAGVRLAVFFVAGAAFTLRGAAFVVFLLMRYFFFVLLLSFFSGMEAMRIPPTPSPFFACRARHR